MSLWWRRGLLLRQTDVEISTSELIYI